MGICGDGEKQSEVTAASGGPAIAPERVAERLI